MITSLFKKNKRIIYIYLCVCVCMSYKRNPLLPPSPFIMAMVGVMGFSLYIFNVLLCKLGGNTLVFTFFFLTWDGKARVCWPWCIYILFLLFFFSRCVWRHVFFSISCFSPSCPNLLFMGTYDVFYLLSFCHSSLSFFPHLFALPGAIKKSVG